MICSWAAVHEDKGVSVAGDHAEEGDISNRNCRHDQTPGEFWLKLHEHLLYRAT